MQTTRYAILTVSSDVLAPDEITARLGITPDETRVLGTASPRTGRLPLIDTNAWELHEIGDRTRWTQRMIDRLRERIAPAEAALRDLVETKVATVMLGVYLYPDRELRAAAKLSQFVGSGFGLEVKAVEWLAGLGAAIDIDIYD